ncbi:hypothetical protein [Tsukamurella tyrosinosolvens]|uniref:LtfC-like domain-containing protein n=1 Tax=Tsukamurella tyrosinosolvens TaxID=57704 RepID=UPI003461E1EA
MLSRDQDFIYSLTDGGQAWPTGTAAQIRFDDDAETVWDAELVGGKLAWKEEAPGCNSIAENVRYRIVVSLPDVGLGDSWDYVPFYGIVVHRVK